MLEPDRDGMGRLPQLDPRGGLDPHGGGPRPRLPGSDRGSRTRPIPATAHICFDRGSSFDTEGETAENLRDTTYLDDDLSAMVKNIHNVLLTRSVRDTSIYVVDPALQAQLVRVFAKVVED